MSAAPPIMSASAGVRWTPRQRMRSGRQRHRQGQGARRCHRGRLASRRQTGPRGRKSTTTGIQPLRNIHGAIRPHRAPGRSDNLVSLVLISPVTPRRNSPDRSSPTAGSRRADHGGVHSCCSARPASLVLGGPFIAVCPNRIATPCKAGESSRRLSRRHWEPTTAGEVCPMTADLAR